MNISFISDLHVDHHIKNQTDLKTITSFIESIIKTDKSDKDVIVIAGDLSHDNLVSDIVIRTFSEHYNHVFIVLGNHDYYLLNSQKEIYHNDSTLRATDLNAMCKVYQNVTLFNNHDQFLYNYKGILFSGCTMMCHPTTEEGRSFYKYQMNDSKYIKADIKQLHDNDLELYQKIKKHHPDIFISHYPTITTNSHLRYPKHQMESFKCDVPYHVAPIQIFGHVHEHFTKYNFLDEHTFYVNTYGYPHEILNPAIQTIHVDVDGGIARSSEK